MLTLDNYEGYLMRYADGVLTHEEATMVETFLAEHPEMLEELEAISDPALHVMPPLATMPGKERLLHKEPVAVKIWLRIAAAVMFVLLAGGITRNILLYNDNPVETAYNTIPSLTYIDTTTTSAHDTLPPDSLYINPGRREPVYLASNDQPVTPVNNEQSIQIDNEETTIQTDTTEPIEPHSSTFEEAVKPQHKNILLAGGMIIIESDSLVTIEKATKKYENHEGVTRGYIFENNQIALEQEKSPLEKVLTSVAKIIMRRTNMENNSLALAE